MPRALWGGRFLVSEDLAGGLPGRRFLLRLRRVWQLVVEVVPPVRGLLPGFLMVKRTRNIMQNALLLLVWRVLNLVVVKIPPVRGLLPCFFIVKKTCHERLPGQNSTHPQGVPAMQKLLETKASSRPTGVPRS